mmetsp:Transcript_31622/g.46900  ORF Transcript_31622/g.46900 Transcript_31622/m.46900 type:complete len:130 (+) Transcript_31622:693-1082(+)
MTRKQQCELLLASNPKSWNLLLLVVPAKIPDVSASIASAFGRAFIAIQTTAYASLVRIPKSTLLPKAHAQKLPRPSLHVEVMVPLGINRGASLAMGVRARKIGTCVSVRKVAFVLTLSRAFPPISHTTS